MLSSEDYNNLENKGADYSYTPGYTLVYLAMNSDALVKYAKDHKERGKDIILFGMPDIICNLCESGCKIVKSATIGDFLSLFHNASKVFTNSFHGIAFSIIYGKDVWIEWNNVQSKSNSRLENIVKKFGLEKRIINEPIIDLSIRYDMIYRIIDSEGKKAMDYIKQMILEIRCSIFRFIIATSSYELEEAA